VRYLGLEGHLVGGKFDIWS